MPLQRLEFCRIAVKNVAMVLWCICFLLLFHTAHIRKIILFPSIQQTFIMFQKNPCCTLVSPQVFFLQWPTSWNGMWSPLLLSLLADSGYTHKEVDESAEMMMCLIHLSWIWSFHRALPTSKYPEQTSPSYPWSCFHFASVKNCLSSQRNEYHREWVGTRGPDGNNKVSPSEGPKSFLEN